MLAEDKKRTGRRKDRKGKRQWVEIEREKKRQMRESQDDECYAGSKRRICHRVRRVCDKIRRSE